MPEKRKKREGIKRRSGSKFWWSSYTDASGKRVQHSTGTTDKREALNLLNKRKTEVWNQQTREIEPDHTFEQLVVLYLNGTKPTKRSASTDVRRFTYLAAYFPEGLLARTTVEARAAISTKIEMDAIAYKPLDVQ